MQTKPSDCPPMDIVIEMLEEEDGDLQMPIKPYLFADYNVNSANYVDAIHTLHIMNAFHILIRVCTSTQEAYCRYLHQQQQQDAIQHEAVLKSGSFNALLANAT
ncbi:stress-induced receptor-like kinase [Trifolium pratense]|uniref:Stress-induced receptor-like kinase n=1 Tax=Trifolium pratense TaxID=57577 RepID=A0A2K3JM27_TRIPR|nr:stress-induced receptor-like kinase [Trifolium pratense]